MWGPYLSYYLHTLRLCAIAIASTLLGPLFLVLLPQGVEVLRTIDSTTLLNWDQYPDEFVRDIAFLAALTLWSLANWYAARLLLQRQFGLPYSVEFTPTAALWRKWLPRVLIGVGGLPIVIKLVQLGNVASALAAAAACGLAYAFAIYRRRLSALMGGASTRRSIANVPPGGLRTDLPEGEELALYLAAATTVVLLIVLSAANYGMARMLGAAAILLLALAAISIGLSVLLVYLPKSFGWPSLTGATIIAAVVFGSLGWTSNHGVAARRVEADAQTRIARPSGHAYWQQWLQAPTTPKDGPIYVVAAEGGASRSGWWTGHILSVLDDATNGDFGRRVFAVSGVSGGSLGLSTWVALRRDMVDGYRKPAHGEAQGHAPREEQCSQVQARPPRADEPAPKPQSLATHSACYLGGDFVSTTLGYMLGVDLFQRVLPAPIAAWDRSNGLEATWARDWELKFGTNHFARPLMELYQPAPEGSLRKDVPLLILNTTSAGQGRPMVQSPVQMPDAEVDDLLDPELRTSGLTLAGAIHNSARFPYVSPAGDVVTAPGEYYDSVVDGGYVENSGALALATLLRHMKSNSKRPEWDAFRNRLVVIFIANDPEERLKDGRQLCDEKKRPLDLTPRQPWGETATPPVGLFMVRSGRAAVSRRALLREFELCAESAQQSVPVYFISMGSPAVREARPAMSWFMRPDARDTMWRAVATDPSLGEMTRLLEHWAAKSPSDKESALSTLKRFGG